MSQSKTVSKKELLLLHEKLKDLLTKGLVQEKKENNAYLIWRFDGQGFSLKAYRSMRGFKLTWQPEEILDTILNSGHLTKFCHNSTAPSHGKLLHDPPNISTQPNQFRQDEICMSIDQENVYNSVLDWWNDMKKPGLLTFGGYAGTGKTTLAAALAHRLGMQIKIAFCAYTGKASNVLETKLRKKGVDLSRHQCSTLHRLLYKPIQDHDGRIIDWKKTDKLDADLVIVDEASMVGKGIWNDLLSLRDVRILAIGDHGQLSPVGDDSISLMDNPMVKLEIIHRQAAGNPILAFSKHVRDGGLPESWTDVSEDLVIDTKWNRDYSTVLSYLGNVKSAQDTIVLCHTNKTRIELNRQFRNKLGFADTVLSVDEPVICLRNKNLKGGLLANGSRGFVNSICNITSQGGYFSADVRFTDDRMTLENGRLVKGQFNRSKTIDSFTDYQKVTGEEIKHWSQAALLFDYAYAITVHKAQGSEFSRVFLVDEFPRTQNEYSRWLYTACSRARDQLVVFCNG